MNHEPRTKHLLLRWTLSEHLVLGLTVLLFFALAQFTPGLISSANLLNILGYLLPLFIVAIGMTLVMITGGIDLSVTSIIALTSVVGAKLMTTDGGGTPAAIGVMAMLTLGAGLGAMNGAVITLLRLQAFIVTLASMMFLSGFAVWLTQSKNIYGLPGSFLALGQRLPIALALTVALAVAAHLMLRRTVFGRWLYALGQNATAAHISGVPVRAMTFTAYVASGFCAALASVMLTGRLETGSPVLGREILLDIIGATVVGGTSLFGGRGNVLPGTLIGAMLTQTIENGLVVINANPYIYPMVTSTVIFAAVLLESLRKRVK